MNNNLENLRAELQSIISDFPEDAQALITALVQKLIWNRTMIDIRNAEKTGHKVSDDEKAEADQLNEIETLNELLSMLERIRELAST